MALRSSEDRCALLRMATADRGRLGRLAAHPNPIVRKNTPINDVALLRDRATVPLPVVIRMKVLGLRDEA